MYTKSLVLVAMATALAGCADGSSDSSSTAGNSYFATNVGRLAGHAEALASLCPTLSYSSNELDLNRAAICEAEGKGAVNCDLPRMDAEKARSFAATIASLNGQSAEQVCANARAEAASDYALASYLVGLPVPRVAAPAPAAPAPAPAVVPEPEPEPESEPELEPELETTSET